MVAIAAASPVPEEVKRDDPVKAGFLSFPKGNSPACSGDGTPAPASNVNYCFNLPGDADFGTWIWPSDDDTYQSIFFIAPDCPADKKEKQFDPVDGTTFVYTAKNSGPINGTKPCLGSIWEQEGDMRGSVWMAPASMPPPGGWPPLTGGK